MIDRIKRILFRFFGLDRGPDQPPGFPDVPDAGKPVPVRFRPPDRGSSVAVAEPDDDD